jgi:Histidine kinase
VRNYRAIIVGFFCIFLTKTSVSISFPDSITRVVTQQKDSSLVESYFSLFRYYFKKDHQPDSMIKYAKLSYKTALRYKLTDRMVKSKRALGLAYIEAKKIILAKEELNGGLELANKSKNAKEIIELNTLLGYLYGKENQLEKSAYYYLNAAKEYEKINDYANVAFNYINIVVIFTMLDQEDKVLNYTRKSIALIPKLDRLKNAEVIERVFSSAAQHYLWVGQSINKENIYADSAKLYADSCLAIGLQYKLTEGMEDAYYVLGSWYTNKADYLNALYYLKKCLKYKIALPKQNVINIYYALSKMYFEKGENELAELYLDSTKLLPVSIENDNPHKIASMEYEIYKKRGKSKLALESLEKLVELKKVQQSMERNKIINELETKYQSELKESQIIKLGQQKEIADLRIRYLIAGVLTSILVLILILFLYRQSSIKNKLKTMEIEQRLNRARMNPHFFFNALASLQNLSLSNDKRELVPEYIAKFSRIMRQSLESTFNELDTIENEIAFLTDYLEVQKLLQEHRFTYTFELDEKIDAYEVLIPGMIIQPFIENCIVHGFKNIAYDGNIKIVFAQIDDSIRITIIDNGNGISDKEVNKKYPSRATQIIRDRLYLLNKIYKSNVGFVEITQEDNTGLKIEINLPLVYRT